jgi:hypothetical protein
VQAYGSDRLRQEGERWILSTRFEKGWTPRVEKTLTTAEYPGTAVLADDQYFEVVAVEAIPNGVRYILEPWRENHAIRVSDRYDAESETARLDGRQATKVRERKRHAINAMGILAGHLPADVQEKIGMEYGILPQWLTYMSCAGVYALGAALALTLGDQLMQGKIPVVLVIVTLSVLFEAFFRTMWAFFTAKPIGSLLGLIAYTIYAASTGTLVVSDLKKIEAPPDHIARADALAMREPLVTLLPPRDQVRVAQNYDYHYQRMSVKVAVTILLFSAAGAFTAARQGHVLGALVAAAVACEQVYRLSEFRRGPAGSVFGYVVRPLVRKLL